jgi:hypothetical protein
MVDGTRAYGTRGLGKSTPLKVRIQGRHFQMAMHWEGPTRKRSVPLTSLALGPRSRRSEAGLCEIGSGVLARVRHGHKTRATPIDSSKRLTGFCIGYSVRIVAACSRRSQAAVTTTSI